MAVLDTRHDLLEEVPRLILNKAPLLNNVVKQLSCLQETSPHPYIAAICMLPVMASGDSRQQECCSHQAGEPRPHGSGSASLGSTLTNSMTT